MEAASNKIRRINEGEKLPQANMPTVKLPEEEIALPEKPWDKYSETSKGDHHRLVKALFKQLEIKDMRTANHCKAVAYYSECMGIHIGLVEKDRQQLKDAALLHDIGKIMVDLSILNKRSTLDSRELLQMQGHSEKGMRILAGFHLSDEIIDAAWHHHERWDGGGYPDGLSNCDINLFTRIISVADAIDAMSAARPYREPLPFETIIQQICEGAGNQFDPKLADSAKYLLEKKQMKIIG